MTPTRNERGMVLVMSCLVIALITAYGSAMMVQTLTEQQTLRRSTDLVVAFQLAESGADQVIVNLQNGHSGNLASTSMSGGTYWADVVNLGNSFYQITSHGLVGQTQRNVEVVVSAGGASPFSYGLFGETSVDLKKDIHTDSYNSSAGAYNAGTAHSNGNVATNSITAGSISIAKDSVINGQVVVGPNLSNPSAAVSLSSPVTITANPQIVSTSSALSLPAVDTSGLSCSSNLSLPKNGTYTFTAASSPYCFKSITANSGSKIAVSGNVVVYADNVNFDKNFDVNSSGKPTQFILEIYGSSDVTIDKDGTFRGAIYAPGLDVHLKKDTTIYGAVAADEIEIDKTLTLHYDEDLVNYGPSGSSKVTIKSWREL